MTVRCNKLGVVAISFNEECDLPGFLENLLHWVDEIVIVDDGSTDDTVAIANQAGDKVRLLTRKRDEHSGFAGQRNFGVEQSSCDWILNMDIDERVTPVLRDEILTAIEKSDFNAFRYRRLNYFLHRPMRGGGWTSWNHPQLARRGKHRYEGILHERCVVDGGPDAIGQLSSPMVHLNDDGYAERMRKSMQYCQLEAERLIERGKPISGWRFLRAPAVVFLKKYILKKGFVDGIPGLISAMHASCAEFRALALAWDKQNKIPREELEQSITEQRET